MPLKQQKLIVIIMYPFVSDQTLEHLPIMSMEFISCELPLSVNTGHWKHTVIIKNIKCIFDIGWLGLVRYDDIIGCLKWKLGLCVLLRAPFRLETEVRQLTPYNLLGDSRQTLLLFIGH